MGRVFPPIALAACVCLIGAVIGVALTLVKFLSDYSCRRSLFTVCEKGPAFSCERAFNSAWGEILGVPTTIWATAFYVAAFALCAGVLKKPAQRERWRLLGLAAFADLAVTAAMVTYSRVVLHAACLYCMSLYATSLLFAILVYFGHRRRPTVEDVPWLSLTLTRAALVPAMIFLFMAAGQTFVYDGARRRGAAEQDCRASIAPLPETALREVATKPQWILAEFVDPSCPHCRSQFAKLRDFAREPSVTGQVEVRFYHFPRDGSDQCTANNSNAVSEGAMANHACLASLAVECTEKLNAGRGVEMLDRMFRLQDGPSPWFSYATIEGVARDLGIDSGAVLDCMRTDDTVSAAVRKHVRYGAFLGVQNTPRLFLIPVRDGAPRYEDAQTVEGDKDLLLLRHLMGLVPKS